MSAADAFAPRRAATMPTRLQPQPDAPTDDDALTLFAHAHTKIFAFGAAIAGSNPSGWGTSRMVDVVPWSTRTERVVAAGPLRLYRLKNSDHVCFLHSGELLLSLLPRSQVWCVDAVSKFAIRIQPYIYRIELPAETPEDLKLLEDFKTALTKVLYYERTPCPFKRGFAQDDAEDLPDPSARKSSRSDKRARKWELKKYWRPEGQEDYVPAYHSYSSTESDEDGNASATSTTDATTPPLQKSPQPQKPEPVTTAFRKEQLTGAPLPVRAGQQQPQIARLVTSPTKLADYQGDRFDRPGRISNFRDSVGYIYARDSGRVASMTSQFSAVAIDSPASLPSVDPESPATPLASQKLAVAKRGQAIADAATAHEQMPMIAELDPIPNTDADLSKKPDLDDDATPTVTVPMAPVPLQAAAEPATDINFDYASSPGESSDSEIDVEEASAGSYEEAKGTPVHEATIESIETVVDEHTFDEAEEVVLENAAEPEQALPEPLQSATMQPSEPTAIKEEALPTPAVASTALQPATLHVVETAQSDPFTEENVEQTVEAWHKPPQPRETPLVEEAPTSEPEAIKRTDTAPEVERPATPQHQKRPSLTLETPPLNPPQQSTAPATPTPTTARRRTASPRSHRRFRSNEIPSYILDDISAKPSYDQSLALALSPSNIVSKTCAILLGPPSGLVQIMVQIASRLRSASASGAFRVTDFRTRSRALPGRWMDSDDEEAEDVDDEDDFGVPLSNLTPARERRREFGFGSSLLQAPMPEIEEGGSYS